MSMNERELQTKNLSCANCLHVRKGVHFNDSNTWQCHAPQNRTKELDIVTGEYKLRRSASGSRHYVDYDLTGEPRCGVDAIWHKPARIYYSDGSSKSVYQIEAEANRTTAKISLRNISLEDLI